MKIICITIFFSNCIMTSLCYRILALFAYDGPSHHVYFSPFFEELALRKHEVTVVNYRPLKEMPHLRQIILDAPDATTHTVNIEEYLNNLPNNMFTDLFNSYLTTKILEMYSIANCQQLMTNKQVQNIVNQEKFDLVIVEQFVTDCGLAIAHKLDAPVMGMTAHTLIPYTYSRLGVPNNPSFVPNPYYGSGTNPDLWNRLQSGVVNIFASTYYRFFVQSKEHEIVRRVYPGTPDLETLSRNITLVLLNQYFPLTGSRLHGANVIEVGGLHIKENNLTDKELLNFLKGSENGVVFISFGSVASKIPSKTIQEILKMTRRSNLNFILKAESTDLDIPRNTFVRKWFPQPEILCHPKVLAFVSHSGMLSSAEAMHCGVPVVSVPLFGDQFSNAKSVLESGLGVILDIQAIEEYSLENAINTVLEARYQKRAKELSKLWKDRPMSPLDTAIYWTEYVARNKGVDMMKPPTVDLPLYKYLMLDIMFILMLVFLVIMYLCLKTLILFKKIIVMNQIDKKMKMK